MRRLIAAALLLYPRAVRRGHAEEIESLVADLIEYEGHSRRGVIARLALDGLLQRITSRATAWVLVITLALTSFGGLVVSDFAAASAHAPAARAVRLDRADVGRSPAANPVRLAGAHAARLERRATATVRAPPRRARARRTRRRRAGIIAG